MHVTVVNLSHIFPAKLWCGFISRVGSLTQTLLHEICTQPFHTRHQFAELAVLWGIIAASSNGVMPQ